MNKPRQQYSLLYVALSMAFCICLIVANLVEIKTIDIGSLTITAGVIVFPISYVINDCIVEVYGLRRARTTIWMGFCSSLAVTLLLQLAIILPGSPQWTSQESMVDIYGSVPRIMLASYLAFISGSMINALTMSRMHRQAESRESAGVNPEASAILRLRHSFGLRAIVSTIFGEGIDSAIFFPIAFGGVLPWDIIISLIVTQTFIKTAYEIIILPVTATVVRLLRRAERCTSPSVADA